MNRASTSKKSRSEARPSLRPKPSVPSEARRRGTQLIDEIRQRLQIVRGRDQHARRVGEALGYIGNAGLFAGMQQFQRSVSMPSV